MDLTTTLFLATDGLTNGAVYTLVGLSLVLVYTTTRVVNIAQGEYVTFGALTLASFVEGTLAPVVYVVAAGGAACLLLDLLRARANGRSLLRRWRPTWRRARRWPRWRRWPGACPRRCCRCWPRWRWWPRSAPSSTG